MTCDSEVYSFGLLFLCIIVGQQEFLISNIFELNGNKLNGYKFIVNEKLEELF